MYENIFNLVSNDFAGMDAWALSGASIGQNYPTISTDGRYKSVSVDVNPGLKIKFSGRFLESSSGDVCYQITAFNFLGTDVLGYVWQSELKAWTPTAPTVQSGIVKTQN